MMKLKQNQTRTYDGDGYKKRAACLCFKNESEEEDFAVLQNFIMAEEVLSCPFYFHVPKNLWVEHRPSQSHEDPWHKLATLSRCHPRIKGQLPSTTIVLQKL
ncbi:uncharacterized protein LOC109911341 [Rhincodon typus]|uniref:uncharacterized protein LOC109911341 n=1 Tax=Rhincodon typus TaxID=259920 RepID=UPI00203088AD|nr:uncharacterized protein LOC109911341 [Rhincodon typus]